MYSAEANVDLALECHGVSTKSRVVGVSSRPDKGLPYATGSGVCER